MPNARFPYGVSNFDTMVSEGYYYLDRTAHIETLERMNSRFNFFLRPRRFGKSLFVSALQYYYGKEHKADFERLFGNYYIGQNPTPRANGYLVLKFDFSGIETDTIETTYRHFLANIQDGIVGMMRTYSDVFGKQEISAVLAADSPALAAQALMAAMKDKAEKIFLIIDEYDHFTNEIIAFNFNNFREIVSQNGFVRKFYEVLKKGTQTGVIDRMFVTGVSPVTLDSLTSGFNIGANLSLDLDLHDLMGFTEAETAGILRAADVPDDQLDTVRTDLRAWYNGYRFNREAVNRLYNPDMVLYFAMHYARYGKYPDRLLDPNVSSDYGKIRRMFRVGNEGENLAILEQIVRDGAVQAAITAQFSFEKRWTRDDFISLLFYMGLLTIKDAEFGQLAFQVPNHVITELYYRYFQEILSEQANLRLDDMRLTDRLIALAKDDDIGPIAEALQTVLERLSNRDARGFDEKYVKATLMALLVPAGVYGTFSEYPVGQGYADIVLWRRPPILEPKHQHLLEVKHLKKRDAAQLAETAEEGRAQLRRYLAHPDIARRGDVLGWLLVVVGYEVAVAERVG
jgi:hypothetical protein